MPAARHDGSVVLPSTGKFAEDSHNDLLALADSSSMNPLLIALALFSLCVRLTQIFFIGPRSGFLGRSFVFGRPFLLPCVCQLDDRVAPVNLTALACLAILLPRDHVSDNLAWCRSPAYGLDAQISARLNELSIGLSRLELVWLRIQTWMLLCLHAVYPNIKKTMVLRRSESG